MSYAFDRMRHAGIHRVRVVTGDDRPAAMSFYRACGFTQVERLERWARDTGEPTAR
jgi:ribosomal protein S18 acetylase RimI-like enzyme